MHEPDAKKKGIAVDTFTRHLRDEDRAIADGEEEGIVRVHVKKGTDTILGATIVARHAGEMISETTLAVASKISYVMGVSPDRLARWYRSDAQARESMSFT